MEGTFDKRQKSAEAKWARDEELRFKVYARRNKLLGLWAAEQMGVSGAEADAYAREVVQADFHRPGDEDVFAKVSADFSAKGIAISDHAIRRTMTELLETAAAQIEQDAKK